MKENSEVERIALHCSRVFRHKRLMLPAPPLLNLPYFIYKIVKLTLIFLRKLRKAAKAALVPTAHQSAASAGQHPRASTGRRSMVDRRKRFTAADPMWQRSLTRFLSEDEDGEDVQHDSQTKGVFLRDAERESRMYVEKFLEQDKHRKEQAIESLAQQSLERLGALALEDRLRRERESALSSRLSLVEETIKANQAKLEVTLAEIATAIAPPPADKVLRITGD